MFCPNCGKKNPDDSRFCESCGTILNEQAAPAAQPAAPQAKPTNSPPPQQQVYAPPVQPVYNATPQANYYQPQAFPSADLTKPMSVWSYIGTYLVFMVPLLNFIMLLVWAFGSNVNINRKNLCRAILILGVIGGILAIVLSIVFASFWASFFDAYNGSFNFGY